MNYELRLLVLLGGVGIVAAGCHGADTLTPQTARCGPTPRLLVSAASYWPADAGDGTVNVMGMAVGGSDLYFSVAIDSTTVPMNPGALMHVSTYGGAATQLADGYQFQTPVVTPTSVLVGVVDESSLSGGILSVPRNGGLPTPLVVLPDDELNLPPVTDGTSVYFNTASGVVEAVPLTPGGSPTVLAPPGSTYLVGMGVFDQRLVLLHNGGRLDEIPIGSSDAGGETMLGFVPDPLSVPGSFISCGAAACWIGYSGVIEELDPASGAISMLPGGPIPGQLFLSFDGTNFFGVAESDPAISAKNVTIERVPQQGGPSVTVAILPPSAYNDAVLAVDDACVYFTAPTGIYSLSSSAQGVSVQ